MRHLGPLLNQLNQQKREQRFLEAEPPHLELPPQWLSVADNKPTTRKPRVSQLSTFIAVIAVVGLGSLAIIVTAASVSKTCTAGRSEGGGLRFPA